MFSVLLELVIVFGVALAVLSVSYRLRVPAVIGFLLTGVLIGPSGLRLVPEAAHVESFAELAVVLMLFVIGLELSTAELRQLGRIFVLGGLAQCFATAALGTLGARLLGAAWPLAVFCGFVVTLSSTAIVIKMHADRRESATPHGRLSLAMLLFQDILIVPMLLLVPLLASGGGEGASGIWATLARSGQGLLVVAGVFVVARLVMPRLLGRLAEAGIHELLILVAMFVCLGAALLTHELGLSMALGGFLAGVALADSDLRYQMQAEVAPFKDVFASIFFTSIGMLLPVGFLQGHMGQIAALTGAIVLGKALIVLGTARLLGYSIRPALLTALALSQIGEFSFVLLQAGSAEGLVPRTTYALLIACSVLSMLLTPLLLAVSGRLLGWLEPAADRRRHEELSGRRRSHTVIAGCGLNGRHIARVLRQAGKHFELVDVDMATIREMRSKGDSVLLGDISLRDIQLAAGVPEAAVLVLALSDRDATRRAVRVARELQPAIQLVVRAETTEEMEELLRLGANEVVTEDLETSVGLTRRVLESLGLPNQAIRSAVGLLKDHHYEALLAARPRVRLTETMLDVLTAGTAESYRLRAGHAACGKSIRDLDLRRRTGATILGVMRADQLLAHPGADLTLEAGDVLVLAGDHASVIEAVDLLEEGEIS